MEKNARRHWSVFLGIWSLALLVLSGLALQIFLRTFYILEKPSKTRPDVYIDHIEADLLTAGFYAVLCVAITQTLMKQVCGARAVVLPHVAVCAVMGFAVLAAQLIRPEPAPLQANIGGTLYEVSRRYLPSHEPKGRPRLRLVFCKDTLDVYFWNDCRPQAFNLWAGDHPLFLGAEVNLDRFGLKTDSDRFTNLNAVGQLREQLGPLSLYEVSSPELNYEYWVTVEATGDVKRMMACFSMSSCDVAVRTRLGELKYRVPSDADRSLAARDAMEQTVLRALEGMVVRPREGT